MTYGKLQICWEDIFFKEGLFMSDIFNNITGQILSVITIISLIFYLLQTFFGYKLFRGSCAVIGFLIGLILGISVSSSFFHLSGAWPPIIGVIAGIIIGIISFKLFLIGLFILVFLISFFLAEMIPFPKTGNWPIFSIVIAVVIAIIAAILAVRYQQTVIIVCTGIGGAINSVNTFNNMTGFLKDPVYYWAAAALLAACGLFVQYLTNRDRV